MYYVYEWFIKDTGEVIYVGKGKGNRYKVRKHNSFFNDTIKRLDCESRIVAEFDSEKEAFEFEYERINTLKEKGECRCNIYAGGFCGSAEWWTDELREKYSINNVMKSESQRRRMQEHNPMKNPDVAIKANSKKRRAVIIGEHRYESVKQAMAEYGVCYDVIARWCKKGITRFGEKCRFEDAEQVVFIGKRYNKGGAKSLTYLGEKYESAVDCSIETGIPLSTIYANLKRGFDIKGNACRYDNDARDLTYENPFKGKPPMAVVVNGKRYASVGEAAEKLSVAKTTLYAYLQGRRKTDKYICEYDNQQPSRGKSDNSTAKGSTTNR